MIIGQTDNMKIQVLFVILILLLPGCLEEENNVIEDQEIIVNWAHNGSRSNITLNIFHGENLDNATTNFTKGTPFVHDQRHESIKNHFIWQQS